MNEFVKQIKTKSNRGNPNWKRGVSGNPKGRPYKPEIAQLREALEKAEEKYDKSFLQHIVERAYVNDQVAIALLRKIVPDKIKASTEINHNSFRALEVSKMSEGELNTVLVKCLNNRRVSVDSY